MAKTISIQCHLRKCYELGQVHGQMLKDRNERIREAERLFEVANAALEVTTDQLHDLREQLREARAETARLKAELLKWEEYARIPEENRYE